MSVIDFQGPGTRFIEEEVGWLDIGCVYGALFAGSGIEYEKAVALSTEVTGIELKVDVLVVDPYATTVSITKFAGPDVFGVVQHPARGAQIGRPRRDRSRPEYRAVVCIDRAERILTEYEIPTVGG